MTRYDTCLEELGEDASDRAILACVASAMEAPSSSSQQHLNSDIKAILLIFAAVLVFFMQAGFAMVCAGAVRQKNVQNTSTYIVVDGFFNDLLRLF
jgi:Ammonium Transporter Family